MSQFTPGPWKVLDIGTDHAKADKALPVVVAEGGAVATVSACANPRRAFGDESLPDVGNVYGCEGWEVGRRTAYANAALIAAAPELYAALVRLLRTTEEGGFWDTDAAAAAARAVLAKVTP